MRILAALFFCAFFFAPASRCQDEHHHELSAEEVGSVHFSTSCSKTVSESFNRAVALLHSFQYEQSRQAFSQVSLQDSTCAMAQWGIAMSHYHGLWGNGDTAAGRVALEKTGVEVVRAASRNGQIQLEAVLAELGRREILSVLLEAGPTLNGAALLAGLVHKLFLFYAPKISGEARVPFAIAPNLKFPPLQKVRAQSFGPDIAIEAYLQDVYR